MSSDTQAATTADTRSLHERKLAVMAQVGGMKKRGQMTRDHKSIRYILGDDMAEAVRELLVAQGVTLRVSVKEVRKGLGSGAGVAAFFEVTLQCPTESETVDAYGEGSMFSAARTYAMKDWAKSTFLIGGDGDATEARDRDLAEKREARRGKPATHPAAERLAGQRESIDSAKAAPASAYAEDPGRKALRQRVIERLRDNYEVPLTDDTGTVIPGKVNAVQTQDAIRKALLELREQKPGILEVDPKGEPDLRLCSNEQLLQLEQHLAPPTTGAGDDLFGGAF